MTLLSLHITGRPYGLVSNSRLSWQNGRSLAQLPPLRRPASIANTRRARVWARSPTLTDNTAPIVDTGVKRIGSVLRDSWTSVAQTGRDHAAQFPRVSYARAATFCLGALVAFVLAVVVRKVLILLLGNVNLSRHDLQTRQESRAGQAHLNPLGGVPAQSDGGATGVIEKRDIEVQEMVEVMQCAAQKVAVMQQLVDASKARLRDEIELSTSLKDEAASLRTQMSSVRDENLKFEQQLIALEDEIQRIEGGQNVSSNESPAEELLPSSSAKGPEHQQEQALNALLLASQTERERLAAVLSASEERRASLQSELTIALDKLSESGELCLELTERLGTAEAEKAALAANVEGLASQQQVALDESAERDESIQLLRQQLAQMKDQMDASSTRLQALQDGSQDQASEAESKLESVQGELKQVHRDKAAAQEATQQAVYKLAQYEQGIVKCVSSILEGNGDSTGEGCVESTEAWWGLPDSQLQEFLQSQQVRLHEATLQKQAIWNKLSIQAMREGDKLQQDVHDAIQQQTGQLNDEASSARSVRQQLAEGKLRDHLECNLSCDHFTTFQALCSECGELEQRSDDLRRALNHSLSERMLQLLAQQMGALQEAAAGQQQAAADAEERDRVQALAQALAMKENNMEAQESQLLQRQDALEARVVAAKESDKRVRELSEQTQQKAEALSTQEQELNQFEQALKRRESRLVAQVERLDAQIRKEEKEEAEKAAADRAVEAAEAEANRLKVSALQDELVNLKEMYSRQFVASKQELDAAQARIQQLRRQTLRPHNGMEPPTDGVTELDAGRAPEDVLSGPSGSVPDSEFSAWASELITKVSRSPPDMPTLDAERSGQHSVSGVPEHQTSERLHASTSTLERQAVTTTTTEEEAGPDEAKELQLESVGFCVPHPAKVERGGEDAHFVLGSSAIGVADGVGGWCKSGVDPGEYSKQLMQYTEQAIRLRSDSTLEVANLGDSGMRIVRDGQIAFATDSLQHGFNMPFQLGNKNLIPYTDVPKNSLQSTVTVLPGDVIVMASDGFFDNVWDEDLARLVKNSCLIEYADQANCVADMAEQLALVAASNSQDQMYRSPWSVECAKQSDSVGLLRKLFPRGGKVDDITVVLSRVGEC